MLEYNIRASSILGFVGAGGLGFVMQVYLQSLEYRRLASVLLLVLVVVLAMDGLSAWITKAISPDGAGLSSYEIILVQPLIL